MGPQLSAFLDYDYTTLKSFGTTGLTLSTASFAFLVAYSEKIIEARKAPKPVHENLNLAFYCFICTAGLSILALLINQVAIGTLQLTILSAEAAAQRLPGARRILAEADASLVAAGLSYVLGLCMVLNASLRMTRLRENADPDPG